MPKDQKNISRAMFVSRKEEVKQELGLIITKFKVSGYVVGWPLEPSGQPGAACGRVLHLLDFLAGKCTGHRLLMTDDNSKSPNVQSILRSE